MHPEIHPVVHQPNASCTPGVSQQAQPIERRQPEIMRRSNKIHLQCDANQLWHSTTHNTKAKAKDTDTCCAVSLVGRVLQEGLDRGASDIHIEPHVDCVLIRYSVDGMLRYGCRVSKQLWPRICARVKVLAGMDIARVSDAQSGRISDDRTMCDFRVSSHPTVYGENLVLRVLRRVDVSVANSTLGFKETVWRRMVYAVRKPGGIVLVTGPTASGKTTTVHALLGTLRGAGRNIMTLEDPVEYMLDGVRQTSVVSEQGFSEGLRSVLRQNPDVIFVGEIRDSQTAQLAFRAAMTGRMVVSTLHTRSTLHSFSRLSDLGISDGLISENLVGVLAQRLVRKKCCGCCPMCTDSEGYRGRTVVAEWLETTPEVVSVVRNNRYDIPKCKELLRHSGMRFIEDEVTQLVEGGVTGEEEVEGLMWGC